MPKGERSARITVAGDGAWGTALAMLLCDNGYDVTLWGAFPEYIETLRERRENVKFLPGVRLPHELHLTGDMAEAASEAELIVMAAPAQFVRSVAERLRPHYRRGVPILSVAKGIEDKTHLRPTESDLAVRVQEMFTTEYFRPYTTDDLVGVELGGALKNIIGVAAGISDGLGFGDNAKSALITRGLAEITRLGAALGARRSTFYGLSGIGDLITTCISPHGRNHRCGVAIGRGQTLEVFLASTEQVIEGVWTCRAVRKLARDHNVEMPICEQVYQVLFRHKSPGRAVQDLMMRRTRPEED